MKAIVLFDGSCSFCNKGVQFIIKRDKNALFQFSSLQSEYAQNLLDEYSLPKELDSMVLVTENHIYTKSDAALEISKRLNGAWKLLFFLNFIPRRLRNYGYDIIAKNRHRLFSKKTSCPLPSQELRERLL